MADQELGSRSGSWGQRREHGPRRAAATAVAGLVLLALAASPALAVGATGATAARAAMSTALSERPHRMAEAVVAIDPRNPRRLVAAADPYRNPVRIVVTESVDGGATWQRGIGVVPSGFTKSYDPGLAVAANGDILVSGGASRTGQPNCQPGSAVFLARIGAGGMRYRIVRAPRAGRYADRPAMALDQRTARAYLTWTESTGPGAGCRAQPTRSAAMLAIVDPDETPATATQPARTLPSSGLPAPFGSTVTVGSDETLEVAIRERSPSGSVERIAVLRSKDQGRTFTPPVVVGHGPLVPASIAGLGGVVAPVPSIAGGPGGTAAIAWSAVSPAGLRTRVAVRDATGRWARLALPPRVAAAGLWPTLAYGGDGSLYLASAGLGRDQVLRFWLWARRGGDWREVTALGSSPSGGYLEVGELLGVASAGGTVAAAVPLDQARGSSLRVWSGEPATQAPAATSTTTPPQPRSTQPAAAPSPRPRLGGAALVLGVAGGAAVAVLLLLGWLRR